MTMTETEAQFLRSALSSSQARVVALEQQLHSANTREAAAIMSLQALQIEMAELKKQVKGSQ